MEIPSAQKRLKLAILFTSVVLVVEVIGGVLAHSLALLSDAAHMLTDVFALCLSWLALKIADQPVTSTKTYGYHRMEIFAAFMNGILLFIMALGILWESAHRMANPVVVHSPTVVGVAVLGLATNLGVIYFLRDSVNHSHMHDLNIKGAFYHVIGDAIASVAVMLADLYLQCVHVMQIVFQFLHA